MSQRAPSASTQNRFMMAPVAIFSALPQEMALLRSWLAEPRTVALGAGHIAHAGKLDALPVALAESGIGKVAIASLATLVFRELAPRAAIFSGVAGGLDPSLEVGDVVVADRLIQHDAGVFGPAGLEPHQAGHLPFFDPADHLGFAPDGPLVVRAMAALEGLELVPADGRHPRIVTGTILTGDVFVNSPAERARLRDAFGGAAVEMEGAALAQVAELFGVPCLVVRALSDLAGEQAPSPEIFARFLEVAAANSGRVVRRLIGAL
jgi:adenosylhomocysteine nucleosidase